MASKERKKECQIDTLKYYFGEDADEWIDLETMVIDKKVDSWRGKKPTEYPPYLCKQCNRYWAFDLDRTKAKVHDYLPEKTFSGIPCDRKICYDCTMEFKDA